MGNQFQVPSPHRLRVFLCHASADKQAVRELYQRLKANNVDAWLDEENLLPGQDWEREIRKAVRETDVVMVCLSRQSITKSGFVQKEIKIALDVADEQPEGTIYIIPVRLEECEVPERLRRWHWFSYFEGNGYDRLISALKARSKSLHTEIIPLSLDDTHNAFLEVIPRIIEFSIEQEDIVSFNADVFALKYAQKFFGTDEIIAHLLSQVGIPEESLRPEAWDYRYIDTRNSIRAHHALFVGVPDILVFNYEHIQEFAARVLNVLADIAPTIRHLAMTIHGAGFGLDEIEAFLAQFRGYLYAFQTELFPSNLEKITIIDRDFERVQRLREAFDENFSNANFVSRNKNRWGYHLDKRKLNTNFKSTQKSNRVIENIERATEAKAHVFVAMPFKKDMDDIFYYGIQQPVRAAGFICERVDQDAFIGDILEQVKKKIETAIVVIAELSGANPNVYLEVGYAWGKGRPTILLLKDEQELRFDVRGQRCLKYERIRDLEESLKKELNELKSKGFI